jgi:hypothetical protein
MIRPFSDITLASVAAALPGDAIGEIDVVGHSPPENMEKIECLRNHFQMVDWTFEGDPVLDDSLLKMNYRMESLCNRIRNNLLQWHSQEQLAAKVEHLTSRGNYEWVIWTRPDLLFLLPIHIRFAPAPTVEVSPHDHWGGINDRFMAGPPEILIKRLRIFSYFVNEWYPAFMLDPQQSLPNNRWCPEMVLAQHLKALNVQVRANYTFFSRVRLVSNQYLCILPWRGKLAHQCSLEIVGAPKHADFHSRFQKALKLGYLLHDHYAAVPNPRKQEILGDRAGRELVPLETVTKHFDDLWCVNS